MLGAPKTNYYNAEGPCNDFIDTISFASQNAYVAKSKLVGRTKSAVSSSKRSYTTAKSTTSNNMKVYIPEEYFRHAGYSAKKTKQPNLKTPN